MKPLTTMVASGAVGILIATLVPLSSARAQPAEPPAVERLVFDCVRIAQCDFVACLEGTRRPLVSALGECTLQFSTVSARQAVACKAEEVLDFDRCLEGQVTLPDTLPES
jgi:hypothetical protein